ncbi:MAG: 30S ribosome-binding factor RbfA [Armatimonadetes bacterium]|nr:30S ribosome-binding factor RbfA [Armatimonadota bacterium]
MAAHRLERVKELIKQEAMHVIRELKDPRLGFVTVTDAEVSPDLRHSKIYVSILGDESAKKSTMSGLSSARGFVRSELGKRIRLRFTPEIEFRFDVSIERGDHISRLIREVRQRDESLGEGSFENADQD